MEPVETREQFIPEGVEMMPPEKEIKITQIMKLEEERQKLAAGNEIVMPVEDLIAHIERGELPEPDKEVEQKL